MESCRSRRVRFRHRLSPVLVSLLCVSAAAAGDGGQPRRVWFGDVRSRLHLAPADERAAVLYAFAGVLRPGAPRKPLPAGVTKDADPRLVFLSVSDGTRPARVVLGGGTGLVAALDDAVARVRRVVAGGTPARWLKLDLVDRVVVLPEARRGLPLVRETSLFGLAFHRRRGLAFLPEEILARRLMGRFNEIRAERITAYVKAQRGSAPPLPGLQEKEDLYRFTTRGYFTDGRIVAPLYRGHRLYGAMSRERALASARAGAAYLVRSLDKTGRFVYAYFPRTDGASKRYNILRHAGTVYALLDVYRETHDARVLEAARRGIGYLLTHIKPMPLGGRETACVVEDDVVKLGGNALAIVALAEYQRATGDRRHLPVMVRLAEWIRGVQDPDTGRFTVHRQRYSDRKVSRFVSDYYPGEALLALARLYRVDDAPADKKRREGWLDVAEKNARYLITVRDNVPAEKQIHDHWLLYALDELYRLRKNPLYLRHARRISRVILLRQRRLSTDPDWLGSYHTPPRSTPTATRTEGLCAACRLLRNAGEATEAQKVLAAAASGLRFQMYNQFGPETAMYLPDPARCLGGIRRSLTDFEIRIDYVQHHISAALGYARLLAEKRTVP